ncbi:MAG: 4-hydroxy-tetrahydrodipicolinate synthase [Rickettsiales bacterium]|nr:4-hydroxy-tetrahydrodipicolinate synthase [Rickettsiales bacterium]
MLKFKGLYTALVTPFDSNGLIDFKALELLLSKQIEAQVDGVVAIGTTAESPTLTSEEYKEVIRFIKKHITGKCRLIVGSGSNATAKSVEKSRIAEDLGADGVLIVNPYYNKPSQDGLYAHFITIADSIDIPVMLYNHPGRTGVNIANNTLSRLIQHKNIISLKEANDDMGQVLSNIQIAGNNFSVLSGNDNLTYSTIISGGHGVISVVSNLLPKETKKMVDLAMSGKFQESQKIHYKMLKLMNALGSFGNPVAVKTLLASQGYILEKFRLPLVSLSQSLKQELINIFEEYKNG